MKRMLRKLARKCGYDLTKLPGPTDVESAFAEMQRLCHGVAEPIIFDVGAHHGHVSKKFRALFPTAKIYAFEPFPASFERLAANTASDPGITAFPFGLSDREGESSFHANPNPATNSLLPTDEAGAKTWGAGLLETTEVIRARFRTIDTVMGELGIPGIDLLKLDVQGAEPLVIQGAAETCRRRAVRLVYSEIIIQPTYRDQKRFDESLSVYYDHGFDLHNVYTLSHTTEGKLRQINALFTRAT